MKTSQNGINLIKHFESLHDGDLSKIGIQPKLCPAGVYTIGWGHAVIDRKTNKFVTKDTPNGYQLALDQFPGLTEAQCEMLLLSDLIKFELQVQKTVKHSLNQNQFDALVSFVFNTGGSQTLFSMVNSNSKDLYEWWKSHYIIGDGRILDGLKKRRKAEADLYFSPNNS